MIPSSRRVIAKEKWLTVVVKWYSKKKKYKEFKQACQIWGYQAMQFLSAFNRIKLGRFLKIVTRYLLSVIRVCGSCPLSKIHTCQNQ